MGLLVDLFEVFGGHVGVRLSRHQIPVTQQFLNRLEIAAPVQEMRGKRMPK